MIRVDDAQFPLVHVEFRGDLSEHEMPGYTASLDALLARAHREHVRVAIVFDARNVGDVPLGVRMRQTAWIRANLHDCRRTAAGFAFVLRSPFLRGILTALSWLCPLPAPHTIAEHVSSAEHWCRARLRSAHAERTLAQPSGESA